MGRKTALLRCSIAFGAYLQKFPLCNNRLAPYLSVMSNATNAIHAARLNALRFHLEELELDGFVVPMTDAFQGEYIPERDRRLPWLTGFTGSAGLAVVLKNRAVLFVDGRYTLQAKDQVDGQLFERGHLTTEASGIWPPGAWLEDALTKDARLGYDPWLHTAFDVARLENVCGKTGALLVPCAANPVDAVWTDQPSPPNAMVVPHEAAYTGCSSDRKRQDVCAVMQREGLDAVMLTAPDSTAWLLNIRGGDVPYTPIPLLFSVLYSDGRTDLFIGEEKIAPNLREHLGGDVSLKSPGTLGATIDALAGKTVRVVRNGTAVWILERLKAAGANLSFGDDPCAEPKACKNEIERAGMRAAHERDGVALVRFLAWLDRQKDVSSLTEIAAADKLEAYRAEHELFRGLSFPTISGFGPNGAIVHYSVTRETDKRFEEGTLYLVDSGAQYPDGTTDVTRTVAIGNPSDEMKDRFTRVLKGHIALASCRFPPGTSGTQLDALARKPLWDAGLDYDHGTGHGVGSYLSVHEGPQRISKMPNRVALRPGMVLSNEPGYYKEGAYGIRLENLVMVTEAPETDGRPMLAFAPLTLAPFDRRLIDVKLLNEEERRWVDAYHVTVMATLSPYLDAQTTQWLEMAARPL